MLTPAGGIFRRLVEPGQEVEYGQKLGVILDPSKKSILHFLKFLPTPSARRATRLRLLHPAHQPISIHALREEGDWPSGYSPRRSQHFYPRPPRGGRPDSREILLIVSSISIHTLRKEGDFAVGNNTLLEHLFLSTPSARRATLVLPPAAIGVVYFYPRPPREGRPLKLWSDEAAELFLSTPSARRATDGGHVDVGRAVISIHALREEGDTRICEDCGVVMEFLSTPSARRATR